MATRNTPEVDDDETSKYTAFRCPNNLLQLAKYKAKKDRRSLSNYIICLIDKDVAGVELPPPPPKSAGRRK